jgi:hypothetical protein
MRRKSLICSLIAACIVVVSGVYFPVSSNESTAFQWLRATKTIPVNQSWAARMGWRYVSYVEGDVALWLSIEPMVKGADRVYVPNEARWLNDAPSWTKESRTEVLARLKSVAWKRKLDWMECECPLPLGQHQVIPGTLESTPGGRALEDRRLFEPRSKLTHETAHKFWHEAARMFAEQTTGSVTIYASEVIPDSVFQAIELPALKKNPNVTLVFK